MSEKNVTVTVKTKRGSLVTVRGDSVSEFLANAEDAINQGMDNVVLMLEDSILRQDAVEIVQETLGATVITPQAATPFAPVAPPASPYSPSAVSASRQCIHGIMTKRTGEGQWGPYKAYMCPTPKGTPDQCKPVYLKATDPEWQTF
jgi:hypothetical protein